MILFIATKNNRMDGILHLIQKMDRYRTNCFESVALRLAEYEHNIASRWIRITISEIYVIVLLSSSCMI